MKFKPIVVAFIVLAVLAGCQDNPSPAAGTAPNPANAVPAAGGGTIDPCSLITTAEATAVLGKPAKDGAPHSSQNTKQCQWDAADGPTGGSVAILVYVGGQKASWSSTLTLAQKLPKFSDIPGLGDGAFSNGFDLHILKGDDMYQIGVAGPFQDNVVRATTIAKEALARV
jgi:Protein of unknown function (DUF3558)